MRSRPRLRRPIAALLLLGLGVGALPSTALAAPAITTAPADPTAARTPAFAGDGAVTGSVVTVLLAPVGAGADPPDLVATPDATGAWAAQVAAPGLADGTYTATAVQAANGSSAAATFR